MNNRNPRNFREEFQNSKSERESHSCKGESCLMMVLRGFMWSIAGTVIGRVIRIAGTLLLFALGPQPFHGDAATGMGGFVVLFAFFGFFVGLWKGITYQSLDKK